MDDRWNCGVTVYSISQYIRSSCLRTSLTWPLTLIPDQTCYSPVFNFSNKRWKLTVKSYKDKELSRTCIMSIGLKCISIESSSSYSIYVNSGSVSDQKGKILQVITDRKKEFHFSSDQSTHSFIYGPLSIGNTSSVTITLNICSVENRRQDLLGRTKEIFTTTKSGGPQNETELPLTTGVNRALLPDPADSELLDRVLKLSSDFEHMYENRQLSDVTLKLGNEEFPAHKSVLSARSRVFAAMFGHDTKENRQSTVDLVQMEAETVQDMLRYVYCAKVRELSSVEALHLYVAADRYDLEELRDICRELITTDISVNDVFGIAAVADTCNDELLITKLKSFISRNGTDIVKTAEWKAMCTDNPVLLTKMFQWVLSG